MSLLRLLLDSIGSNVVSIIIITATLFTIYRLALFFSKLSRLPPGPLPVPLLGNHWAFEMEPIVQKYGPIFTLWLGHKPRIFIADIDIAVKANRKIDFSGRIHNVMARMINTEDRTGIALCDYGQTWEALRRVSHSSVQKYSTTENLLHLVIDCVDDTIENILKKEGTDQWFVPFEYITNLFINILSESAFSKRYTLDEPEYKFVKYCINDLFYESSFNLFLWEFFPIIQKIDPRFRKTKETLYKFIELIRNKYQDHDKKFKPTMIHDFCDTLINAKNVALKEGKESAHHLTDNNLVMVLYDLFLGGVDTSQNTFKWLLFHLLKDQSMETRLRREVESEIGDRLPTHEDRNRCHYVMAFIYETLRHSNVAPHGVSHKCVVDSKIGEYTIEKGCEIITFQGYIMHNPEHWANPWQFTPDRFLDSNGRLLATRPKSFIPFGVGRRVCLGESMAIADLFLIVVRLLQKTSNYELKIELSDHSYGDDIYVDRDVVHEFNCKSYRISLNTR